MIGSLLNLAAATSDDFRRTSAPITKILVAAIFFCLLFGLCYNYEPSMIMSKTGGWF